MNRDVKVMCRSLKDFTMIGMTIVIMEIGNIEPCEKNEVSPDALMKMVLDKELVFTDGYHLKEEDIKEYPLVAEIYIEEYDNVYCNTLILSHYNGNDLHTMIVKAKMIDKEKEHQA